MSKPNPARRSWCFRSTRWDAARIADHVEKNYALQERLYALALLRMLDIKDATAYEARFGGTLYVFVRGLGRSPHAIRSRRPSFDEVVSWQRELAGTLERGDMP